jgi:hypothetical protein
MPFATRTLEILGNVFNPHYQVNGTMSSFLQFSAYAMTKTQRELPVTGEFSSILTPELIYPSSSL